MSSVFSASLEAQAHRHGRAERPTDSDRTIPGLAADSRSGGASDPRRTRNGKPVWIMGVSVGVPYACRVGGFVPRTNYDYEKHNQFEGLQSAGKPGLRELIVISEIRQEGWTPFPDGGGPGRATATPGPKSCKAHPFSSSVITSQYSNSDFAIPRPTSLSHTEHLKLPYSGVCLRSSCLAGLGLSSIHESDTWTTVPLHAADFLHKPHSNAGDLWEMYIREMQR
ncbi:hypothetical protein K402DRAFT_438174 [Aulographum hederae CBS 113979]|uniref:Uncharacterized protein n=1 Tax=Aulographum hederae CBS 113979 TaxID=1176131 RepID=A0A6G1HBI6_9PEZI|nr:hypothetical protein K402DRAFT_438174 [Aulographum hederae CBS 113979]